MLGRFVIRRIVAGLLVLFAITYVAFFAQDIAARQRAFQPAPFGSVAVASWSNTLDVWNGVLHGDLGQYGRQAGWTHPSNMEPMTSLLGMATVRSAALLLASMALGGILGGLIGIAAAAFRRKSVSMSMLMVSIVGVSTPSFFLAVLLQFGIIEFYKATGTRLLPAGGFGYDLHMVLPVLVLSARPIAQVARITSAHMENLMNEDFVRTARSKGLIPREVWLGHIVPNAAGAVITAVASSLRFSLSSLPLVETFFGWRGLGFYLLERIEAYDTNTVVALVLATGLFFVVTNGIVDFLYRLLDPRLRKAEEVASAQMEGANWAEMAWSSLLRGITLKGWRERRAKKEEVAPLPVDVRIAEESKAEMSRLAQSMRWGRLRAWRRATVGNPALALGAILGVALLVAVVAGPQLTPHNPYTTLSLVDVNGQLQPPPFAPSSTYPLGTDRQGRDILSLLLAGARRTLTLALVAVVGRMVIGGIFGFLAGWFQNSLLDRGLMAVGEVINSFPALLLATLVVYAVGVRQGMIAFVVGLLVISWPEVMQNVRAQVISVRPMAYIEGALATGAGQGQILTRHVLPNIWPTLVSLAFLEMGGALMILGELGFLGVFIGGGLASGGDAIPGAFYYDIPEWGVMMANSWASFRSYPWTMIYPALAFMIAIIAFTLLGEGLRRMAEELTLSMRALFNRYTFVVAIGAGVLVWWVFQSTSIWAQYKPIVDTFDAQRVVTDVQTLASSEFEGRQIGTPGADAAADWIARQFEGLGLVTCGEDWTYFQTVNGSILQTDEPSSIDAWDKNGNPISLTVNHDYAEASLVSSRQALSLTGEVVYASAPGVDLSAIAQVRTALGISTDEATSGDKILLVYPQYRRIGPVRQYYGSEATGPVSANAVLLIEDDPSVLLHRELPGLAVNTGGSWLGEGVPVFYVTPQAADRLLAGSGYTLSELRQLETAHVDGQGVYLRTGTRLEAHLSAATQSTVPYRNVLAIWPGEDTALDSEMIIISAYYDGQGQVGDVLYPGANDNATGVATMLELIRSWKEWGFKPKRTILFVAWAGGERYVKPDISYFLSARPGMDQLTTLAVFELEGLGDGSADQPLMWRSTSERVTSMVLTAARQVGLSISPNGDGLHSEQLPRVETDKKYPLVYFGWPGSGANAHLPSDTAENLDPQKIEQVGKIVSMVTAAMATDPTY